MRTIIIASLLAFAAAGTAFAADDSASKSAKKTSEGFGNLLKGMGQEVKKVINSDDTKKDKKKETKQTDDKSGKAKENK